MPIPFYALIGFAALDVLVCGTLLLLVGTQYHSLRRLAAADGRPLPGATMQFLFIGGMMAFGVIVLLGCAAWMIPSE